MTSPNMSVSSLYIFISSNFIMSCGESSILSYPNKKLFKTNENRNANGSSLAVCI